MLFYTHIYIYFFLISQLQSYETPEHQHQNETVNTKLLSDATGKWKGSLSIKKKWSNDEQNPHTQLQVVSEYPREISFYV